MIYEFKANTICPLPAQVVGEVVNRLEGIHGGVTASMLVEEARPEDAPLHPAFEWDDAVAAEEHRRNQARYLMRMLVIKEVEDGPDVQPPAPIRAFVSVTTPQGDRQYMSVVTAMSDAELRNQIIEKAWRELLSWRERYQNYEEFANVFRAIDEVRSPRKLQ
jgi:hypothetical protein